MWDSGSLLATDAEDFVILVKTPASDGLGGIVWAWADGPTFTGLLRDDHGTTARIGAVQTGKTFGALFTPRSVELSQFDAFRRASDGMVYRVSEANSNDTPKTSNMDLRRYPVEQWRVPE